MIELNLTYEESKKILELGYDFTPVCWQFELRDYMGVSKFFTRLDKQLVIECDCEIDYINYNGLRNWCESYKMGQLSVPIIPKAALEACLPESIWSYPQGSHLDIANGRIGYVLNGKQIPFVRFDSVYEAFLWVHEKAQKELRKKFEEVMG